MGSGGSQVSNTVSEFKPPSYTQPGWTNYVNNATGLAGQGLPVYTGQTVAPLSQQGQAGIGMLTSLATQGSPLYNSAQTNLTGTLQGDFSNPYATAANPYMGNNPYVNDLVNQSNQRITDAYSQGTAAQMAAAQARAGAFGGSSAEEANALANRALGDTLAQNTSGILGQNYYNSGQLAENALNRATQSVQAERQNQLTAAGLAPQYQSSDINAIQAMMGGGDAVQQYQQQLLNAAQGLFNQYTQAPWALSDLVGSALSRASGQGGSQASQIIGPGSTWGQNLLGGGLLAGSLASMFGG